MNGKDLTHGSITGNILSFSLPYMLAYFLQILYGLADLYPMGLATCTGSVLSCLVCIGVFLWMKRHGQLQHSSVTQLP